MAVYYDVPVSPWKRLVCYLQGQAHSEGSYNLNMTVCSMSTELLVCFEFSLMVHQQKSC